MSNGKILFLRNSNERKRIGRIYKIHRENLVAISILIPVFIAREMKMLHIQWDQNKADS